MQKNYSIGVEIKEVLRDFSGLVNQKRTGIHWINVKKL
jgi:hypothetical protein